MQDEDKEKLLRMIETAQATLGSVQSTFNDLKLISHGQNLALNRAINAMSEVGQHPETPNFIKDIMSSALLDIVSIGQEMVCV